MRRCAHWRRPLAEGTLVVGVAMLVVVFLVKVVALTAVSAVVLIAALLGAAGRVVGGCSGRPVRSTEYGHAGHS